MDCKSKQKKTGFQKPNMWSIEKKNPIVPKCLQFSQLNNTGSAPIPETCWEPCTKIIHLIKKGHFFFQFRSRIKVAKNLQFMFHPYKTYDEVQRKNISEIQDNIPERNTVSRIYVFTSYLKRWNQWNQWNSVNGANFNFILTLVVQLYFFCYSENSQILEKSFFCPWVFRQTNTTTIMTKDTS